MTAPTQSSPAAPTPRDARAGSCRAIIHIDMDAFFASVEQLDNPELKGKPVAVGGDPQGRGVVSAASYEARPFGVRSAMPMSQAVRLCPELVCVRPRIGRYAEVSRRLHLILKRWTPLVEAVSLDEAYLDVSDAGLAAEEIARRLKEEIREELGLSASAGIGPCKLVAKIASDMRKPDGLVVVEAERVESFLAPLPVGRLWGVGPVTERRIKALGIETIGQLAAATPRTLSRLGPSAATLARLARGEDLRPVSSDRATRSISCERTLEEDTRDLVRLDRLLEAFAQEIQGSLRDEGARARTVTLKLRYSDFELVTRSRTLRSPFDEADVIAREARSLILRTQAGRRKVRLVGVTVSGITGRDEPYQRALFP